MKEFEFTVTSTGSVFIEANSEEEAREKYENNRDDYYIVTQHQGEQPADESWELEPKLDQEQFDQASLQIGEYYEMAYGRQSLGYFMEAIEKYPELSLKDIYDLMYEEPDEEEEA